MRKNAEKVSRRGWRLFALAAAGIILCSMLPAGLVGAKTARPTANGADNVAMSLEVLNNGRNETQKFREENGLTLQPNTAGSFRNLKVRSSYSYTARVHFGKDTSGEEPGYGGIFLSLGSGYDASGARREMQICVRPGLGQAILSSNIQVPDDDPDLRIKPVSLVWGGSYTFTVVCAGGRVSFWLDEDCLYDGINMGLKNVTLQPGFGSVCCEGRLSDVQIWGTDLSVLKAPVLDPVLERDLIGKVTAADPFSEKTYRLVSGAVSNEKENFSALMGFGGVELSGNYTLYANASYQDNKNMNDWDGLTEYDHETLLFQVAAGTVDNQPVDIVLKVRKSKIYLMYTQKGNPEAETLLSTFDCANDFDRTAAYILEYQQGGSFNFWKDGAQIITGFDLTATGVSQIRPETGIGGQVCRFAFSQLHLVCPTAETTTGAPAMPRGNGNYAAYMWPTSGGNLEYASGVLRSTVDDRIYRSEFRYLPFTQEDTYVYGCNIRTDRAVEFWMGPRFIIGELTNDRELQVFITQNKVMVMNGDDLIQEALFPRELGREYHVDLLIEPHAVSVWIDDIPVLSACQTPDKRSAKTGMQFSNTVATVSDIVLYYTAAVKFVQPDVPQQPQLKTLGQNQYNAADWMKVSCNGEPDNQYFGNRLSATAGEGFPVYRFSNMPVKDAMSYYYSASFRVTQSELVWQGPRFIFRRAGAVTLYMAVLQDRLLILAGDEEVADTAYTFEKGVTYDLVIYTTPTHVTAWVNGKLLLEYVPLTAYNDGKPLEADTGLVFSQCSAEVTNLSIYGEQIVFDADYVDMDLYNSRAFRMAGIPAMPQDGVELFRNITMTDEGGTLSALFDSAANTLSTAYARGTDMLRLRDANGSKNLNGLKNGAEYVFSFDYQVNDWQSEKAEDSGFWLTIGDDTIDESMLPIYRTRVGVTGKAVCLNEVRNSQTVQDIEIPFARKNGQKYAVAIVHGRTWVKVFVDQQLVLVATDLDPYNTCFDLELHSIQAEFDNFHLYECAGSNLTVLPEKTEQTAGKAGNTLYGVPGISRMAKNGRLWLFAGGGAVIVLCGGALTGILLYRRKKACRAADVSDVQPTE